MATREEIFDQMEQMLGRVPSFMVTLPETVLESDWNTMKSFEFSNTKLSAIQKHLIGVGVAAANSCEHMSLWHGMMAMALGATDEQIDEALLTAKLSSGWSTYLEGSMVDMDQFTDEAVQIGQFIQTNKGMKAA
ncbi:MAG TPA: carboxymuconolactone decarboxylase family protein [Candidatus Aquicultor sp.]|jgi:AhpD family alkylhydroperoxidase